MVDMHIHTVYSDGLDGIEEIVQATKKFDLFSITDHDNIIPSQKVTANNFVSGVELSIRDKDLPIPNDSEIHLLAYDFDPFDKDLNRKMTEFNYYNNLVYIKTLIDIALANNIKIDLEYIKKYIYEKVTLSKVQLTKILIEQKYGTDIMETYHKFIKGYCNQKHYNLSFKEIYEIIKKCNGYLLLAHPFVYSKNQNDIDILIQKLYKLGIDGIELTHSYQKETLEYIQKYNFIYSLGSDYHGKILANCNTLGVDDLNDDNYLKNKLRRKKHGL